VRAICLTDIPGEFKQVVTFLHMPIQETSITKTTTVVVRADVLTLSGVAKNTFRVSCRHGNEKLRRCSSVNGWEIYTGGRCTLRFGCLRELNLKKSIEPYTTDSSSTYCTFRLIWL
jgi:hypothetical protein